MLSAEQSAQLHLFEVPLGRRELLGGLDAGRLVVFFQGEFEKHLGLFERGFQTVEEHHFALDPALFLQDLLRGLPVVPEVRSRALLFELLEPLALRIDVKAAPGARRSAGAGRASVR